MKTTWIVAADASRARIFEMLGRAENLHEIETFVHPASREHDRDLVSDAHGRFQRSDEAGQSAPERTDASEHEAQLFSRTLSTHLEQARNAHRYDQLRLIAAPKFLGLLRQNLSKEAQKLIEKETPKNLSWFDSNDIASFIKTEKAAEPTIGPTS